MGINATTDNRLVAQSDIVILAVKPHQVENVLKEIRNVIEGRVLVSVAAMVPMNRIRQLLGDGTRVEIYRAMPNINVEVNNGLTALTGEGLNRDIVDHLFSLLGKTLWVDERTLDLMTIVTACTPAVISEIIDAFILAALYIGIPKDIAEEAIAYTFIGTSMNALRNGVYKVRNRVITPRGHTIKILKRFLETNVKHRIVESLIEVLHELEKPGISYAR